MSWQYIRIARFGGPEVLELAEQAGVPDPGPGEVRIKCSPPAPASLIPSFGAAAIRTSRGRCRSLRATNSWESSRSRPRGGRAARGSVGGRSLRRAATPIRDPSRAIPGARPRWRRSGGGGVYPARLLPPSRCSLVAATAAGRHDPRDRRFGHGRHGPARSGAPLWPQGDRDLLGREHVRGRTALGPQRSTIAPATSSRPSRADRKSQRRRWSRRRLRCNRRRPFRSLVRLPRVRRAAGRLRVADHGGRTRGLLSAGLGLARLKLWERVECPVRRSSRGVLQHHRAPIDTPEEFKADMATLFDLLRAAPFIPSIEPFVSICSSA